MDEVFQAAAERLSGFVGSADYSDFLKKSASRMAQIAGDAPITLLFRPADLEAAEGLKTVFSAPAELCADETIRIGGLRAQLPDKRLRLDDTLDARLESQREWFMEHSGLTIGEA